MAKAGPRDALALELQRIGDDPPAPGSWLFFNASPLPGISHGWKESFQCVQGFRPDFLLLNDAGYRVEPTLEVSAAGNVAMLIGRNRVWNQHHVSNFWNAMKPGATLVVAGAKNNGIASLKKWFSDHVSNTESYSKYHSVVFQAEKQTEDLIPVVEIHRQVSGYDLEEGMFSSSGPDRGSLLLSEHFSNRIKGAVADFGAGWGFLSNQLLSLDGQMKRIELFEADFRSLEAARSNVKSDKVELDFHWIDISTEFRKRPFDWVIMNPPFHQSRAAIPDLGRKFIQVAASTLVSGGKLLMVANRNLPYEATLKNHFRSFETLTERDGFKVIEARK